MDAAARADALAARLVQLLTELGYQREGRPPPTAEHVRWAFDGNTAEAGFLEWLVENVSAERNALSSEEEARLRSMEADGTMPPVDALRERFGPVEVLPMPYTISEIKRKTQEAEATLQSLENQSAMATKRKERMTATLANLNAEVCAWQKVDADFNVKARNAEFDCFQLRAELDRSVAECAEMAIQLIDCAQSGADRRYLHQCKELLLEFEKEDVGFLRAAEEYVRGQINPSRGEAESRLSLGDIDQLQSSLAEVQQMKLLYVQTEMDYLQALMDFVRERANLAEVRRQIAAVGSLRTDQATQAELDHRSADTKRFNLESEAAVKRVGDRVAQCGDFEVVYPALSRLFAAKVSGMEFAEKRVDELLDLLAAHRSRRAFLSVLCSHFEDRIVGDRCVFEAFREELAEIEKSRENRLAAVERTKNPPVPVSPAIDRDHDVYFRMLRDMVTAAAEDASGEDGKQRYSTRGDVDKAIRRALHAGAAAVNAADGYMAEAMASARDCHQAFATLKNAALRNAVVTDGKLEARTGPEIQRIQDGFREVMDLLYKLNASDVGSQLQGVLA